MWQQILAVGLGGAVGAIARYLLSALVQRPGWTFPIGTLFVNVIGCLVLGALMTLFAERESTSVQTRLFLTVGLLGSFTTFSTFGFETFVLVRDREVGLAIASVAANVAVGLGAVLLGRALVRAAL